MARYRSEYPESYNEGSVNRTFSISKAAYDLLVEEIENHSAFVNDLIIEALQQKDFFKKRAMRQFNSIREELDKKHGLKFELREVKP